MIDFIDLKNKDSKKLIDGVLIRPLKVNADESGGILVETLRKDWQEIYSEKRPFFMQYYSITPPGMARDENVWHKHPTYQEDRFFVIDGEVVVAIADLREGSQTAGQVNLFRMNGKEPYMLLVPQGTLHGFLVTSSNPAILLNYPTGLYNPAEEGRVPFEEANIKFPDGNLFSWDLVREALPKGNEQ